MAKKKYDDDFKVMIAELLLSGISGSQVSREYGLSVSMIGRWRREYLANKGNFNKKKEVSETEKELRDLKKKLRDVTMERDILKKAVSIELYHNFYVDYAYKKGLSVTGRPFASSLKSTEFKNSRSIS